MEMEQKLIAYRTKKRREALLNQTKEKITNFFSVLRKRKSTQAMPETKIDLIEKDQLQEPLLIETASADEVSDISEDSTLITCTTMELFYYFLWFIFWATLYGVFIKLQFGMVYLIVSAVVAMYFNTRTEPRKTNEVSAYSVFNKNCESIEGTLKAEQFEREIRYGSSAVH